MLRPGLKWKASSDPSGGITRREVFGEAVKFVALIKCVSLYYSAMPSGEPAPNSRTPRPRITGSCTQIQNQVGAGQPTITSLRTRRQTMTENPCYHGPTNRRGLPLLDDFPVIC